MTLRTSLVITGDTNGAQAAVRDLGREMDGAGASAQRLGDAERKAESASGSLTAEMRRQAQAAAGIVGANDNVSRSAMQLFAAEQRLEAALAALERAHRQAAAAADNDANAQLRVREAVAGAEARAASAAAALQKLQQGQRGATDAGDAHFRSLGQQRQGAMMLGQQVQDMGIQLSMGTGVMQVLAMQAGQTAYAIDQMGAKGAAGRVAAFFMMPWGAAVMTAAMVLGPLVAGLRETDEAQKAVELGANSLGEAQGVLGQMFDLQTGKIKNNTEALLLNAKAKAINLRASATEKEASSAATIGMAGMPSKLWMGVGAAAIVAGVPGAEWAMRGDPTVSNLARLARDANKITDEAKRAQRMGDIMSIAEGVDFSKSGTNRTAFIQALVDAASARNDRALASMIDQSTADGRLAPGLMRPGSGGGRKRVPSTSARDEFGRDAADTIAGIVARHDGTGAPFRQAQAEIRKLDDLIEDLGRRQPPNFATLIKSAEDAKTTVQQGLIQAVTDAFEKPETLGAKAAKVIGQMDAQMAELAQRKPPNFEKEIENWKAAKGVVEDSLLRPYDDYIEAQEEQLEIQRLVNAGRLDEAETLRVINGLKAQDVPLDDAKVASMKQLNAELREAQRESERLRQSQQKWLNALGDVRGQITGVIANPAGIVDLPEQLLGSFRQLTAEYLFDKMFGSVFDQLQDEITGGGAVQRSAMKTASSLDGVAAAANKAAAALMGAADPGGILVTAGAGDQPTTMKPTSFMERTISELLHKGLKIDETAAKNIGKIAGKGLEGAMQGQMASGVASLLGIKQSSGGASIGGAIGGMVLGPVGGFLGGLLGGTIGGLFNSPKYSTASVTSATGDSGLTGSNAGLRKGAGGLAEQVQGGLKQIADQLGGDLGSFSLSIGTWDGRYRVNTNATSKALHSKNFGNDTLYDFGDDAAGAVAFAIADAVKDGAVTGLSAAVQKAIQSNPDINAALAEALKVADLELILGGVDAEMIRAFKSFETQAKDRLRIATEYGFDVVAVEKLNAKERLDLTNQLIDQQVGSLQRLVDEMTSGSMFEGTKVEQRAALMSEIAKAQADLDAGVAGAADRLAGLFEQLNTVSKDVYGTTGGFATDRAAILDQARAAIAQANAEIRKAQEKVSDPALKETNAALDENNDQNARMIAALESGNVQMANLLAMFGVQGSTLASGQNVAELARTS